jgi:hypothetical protein
MFAHFARDPVSGEQYRHGRHAAQARQAVPLTHKLAILPPNYAAPER